MRKKVYDVLCLMTAGVGMFIKLHCYWDCPKRDGDDMIYTRDSSFEYNQLFGRYLPVWGLFVFDLGYIITRRDTGVCMM